MTLANERFDRLQIRRASSASQLDSRRRWLSVRCNYASGTTCGTSTATQEGPATTGCFRVLEPISTGAHVRAGDAVLTSSTASASCTFASWTPNVAVCAANAGTSARSSIADVLGAPLAPEDTSSSNAVAGHRRKLRRGNLRAWSGRDSVAHLRATVREHRDGCGSGDRRPAKLSPRHHRRIARCGRPYSVAGSDTGTFTLGSAASRAPSTSLDAALALAADRGIDRCACRAGRPPVPACARVARSIARALRHLLAEAGRDHRDLHLVAHALVQHRAEDDVAVLMRRVLDDASRPRSPRSASGARARDVDQDAARSVDRAGLQQRRSHRGHRRIHRAVLRRVRIAVPITA